VREGDASEGTGSVVVDSGVGRELVTGPQHHRLPTRLEEDRLVQFLAAPAKLLVKGERPSEVGDAERNETHPLLHASDRT
jgi:hypothetical protein